MLRKIGFGAGFWGIMFLAVSALIVSPLPDIWQKILEIIIAGVAAYILGVVYFRKTPGDIKDAIILGVIWLIVGTILDLLITVQYVRANQSYVYGLKAFYGMWSLWVSFVFIFIGLIGAAKTTKGSSLPPAPTPLQ